MVQPLMVNEPVLLMVMLPVKPFGHVFVTAYVMWHVIVGSGVGVGMGTGAGEGCVVVGADIGADIGVGVIGGTNGVGAVEESNVGVGVCIDIGVDVRVEPGGVPIAMGVLL